MIVVQAGPAFDQLAERYDVLWSESAIGQQQRAAVWRRIDPLFHAGDRVLDIGCGTGVDGRHLIERGIEVCGIDASKEMVRVARSRGVDANHMAAEDLGSLAGEFDGAISNFGGLNCVSDLRTVARALGRLIRLGGHVAICLAGPCCAWETAHYFARGEFSKAIRRWNPRGCDASIGVHVDYPSVRGLVRVFRQDFRLTGWYGIGLCVPPSYVDGISETNIERLAALDRRLAHLPALRALADHRLLLFRRV
jgi:SAM-dependent methyltransferase